MKTILTAVAVNEVLNRFKPVEMLPYVGKFAGEVQLIVGVAGAYGVITKKWESDIAKGIAIGLIASGVTKTLNKYLPKSA